MAVGNSKTMYRRNYICVNPDPSTGPDTWRLASPQEIGSNGGGGAIYQFEGKPPIDVTVTPQGGSSKVETSLDITQLSERA